MADGHDALRNDGRGPEWETNWNVGESLSNIMNDL